MNVAEKSEFLPTTTSSTSAEILNVLPLFGTMDLSQDPLEALLLEAGQWTSDDEDLQIPLNTRLVAGHESYPEQSLYILDEQLRSLKESLNRLRFYLGDIDDLLPR